MNAIKEHLEIIQDNLEQADILLDEGDQEGAQNCLAACRFTVGQIKMLMEREEQADVQK